MGCSVGDGDASGGCERADSVREECADGSAGAVGGEAWVEYACRVCMLPVWSVERVVVLQRLCGQHVSGREWPDRNAPCVHRRPEFAPGNGAGLQCSGGDAPSLYGRPQGSQRPRVVLKLAPGSNSPRRFCSSQHCPLGSRQQLFHRILAPANPKQVSRRPRRLPQLARGHPARLDLWAGGKTV